MEVWMSNLLESLKDGPVRYKEGEGTKVTQLTLVKDGLVLIENNRIRLTNKGQNFVKNNLKKG